MNLKLSGKKKKKATKPVHPELFNAVFQCEKEKKKWMGIKPAVLLEAEQKGLASSLPPAKRTENENTL